MDARAISLWYTNSTLTQGTDNIVEEIFSPGGSLPGLCGNSSCDMAFGDFTINWWRQSHPNARFSSPWMMGGYQILARQKPHDSFDWSVDFISPFEPSLWLIIFGMLIGLSVMVVLIESASALQAVMGRNRSSCSSGQAVQESTEMTLGEGLWFGFQTLFATQDNGMLDTKLARFLVWCWQLSVIAILSTYTATYTNIIASDREEWAIGRTLGTGADAYTTLGASVQACPYCITTQKGGAAEKYFNGTLRMDFSQVHDERTLPGASSVIDKIGTMMMEDTVQSVWIEKTSSMKYITEQVMLQTSSQHVCQWKTVGAEFGIGMQGIPFAPNLPHSIADAIDRVLSQLMQDLTLKSLENQWIRQWTECLMTKTDTTQQPVTPKEFHTLFMTVTLIACVSFIYRLITDYAIAVQMNPENHDGMLGWFFKSAPGKLLFGVDLKSLDRPYSSHAILCELRWALMQRRTNEAWVRKYNSTKGVYFFVNAATGECSWTEPSSTLCEVSSDAPQGRRHRRVSADHYRQRQNDVPT